MKRLHIKPKSFAISVLKGVAITGMVLIAASNPYFARNLWKTLRREYRKKKWREWYHAVRYLKRQGYVDVLGYVGDQVKIKITNKGKAIIKQLDIEQLKLKKPATWDQTWRVVIFDVPNWKSKNRLAFTERIKNLGFRMMQKSVWAYPHECHEEIMILRSFYDIEKYVTYLETAMVEDEIRWQEHFTHLLKNTDANVKK